MAAKMEVVVLVVDAHMHKSDSIRDRAHRTMETFLRTFTDINIVLFKD